MKNVPRVTKQKKVVEHLNRIRSEAAKKGWRTRKKMFVSREKHGT